MDGSPTETRVKVCGLTDPEDAALAVELGAWAVGLIFWRPSPRSVRSAAAERVAAVARRRALVTGVFLDHPLDEIVRLHDRIGFDMVQLHGAEGPAFGDAVARRTGAKVLKAMRVADAGDVQALHAFRTADLHLVDAPARTHELDRRLLRGRHSEVPLVLAGGLRPDNVAEAIAEVEPYAVDTASGTEGDAPGRKDPQKLEAFFAAVAGKVVAE